MDLLHHPPSGLRGLERGLDVFLRMPTARRHPVSLRIRHDVHGHITAPMRACRHLPRRCLPGRPWCLPYQPVASAPTMAVRAALAAQRRVPSRAGAGSRQHHAFQVCAPASAAGRDRPWRAAQRSMHRDAPGTST